MYCDQTLGILPPLSKTEPWKIWANRSELSLKTQNFSSKMNFAVSSVGSC